MVPVLLPFAWLLPPLFFLAIPRGKDSDGGGEKGEFTPRVQSGESFRTKAIKARLLLRKRCYGIPLVCRKIRSLKPSCIMGKGGRGA